VEEDIVDDRLVWAFDVEIDDDPTAENYYIINGNFDIIGGGHDNYESEINGYIEPHFSHFTDDPNAENKRLAIGNDFESYPLRNVYIPDNNFNGKKYKTRVGVMDYDLNNGQDGNRNQNIVGNIIIRSVSKEMFDYMISLEELRLNTDESFAEPKQVFTNIKDGVGIFAGYTEQKHSADLPNSLYHFPNNISADNDGCTAPCTVNFSNDGGAKLNYFWDFGDGQNSNEQNVDHLYTQPGIYQINLSATRSGGSQIGASFEVTIN